MSSAGAASLIGPLLRRLESLPAAPVVVLHVPLVGIDAAAPERLLSIVDDPVCFLWGPEADDALAAVGAVRIDRLDAAGRSWTERAKALLQDLREEVFHLPPAADDPTPTSTPPATRLLFALPFEPDGAGLMLLPRWRLMRSAGGDCAWLSVALTAEERATPALRDRLAGAIATTIDQLSALDHTTPASTDVRVVSIDHGDTGRYQSMVRTATDEIAAGRLRKVVLARRAQVMLSAAPAPAWLYRRLEGGSGTRFVFTLDGAAWAGRSPERLVSRHGRRVSCDALAGSSSPEEADRLGAGAKEREEHALVVEAIAQRLRPLGGELEIPTEPRVRRLPTVAHLHTPVTLTLPASGETAGDHLLELVSRLHPTPATGGLPSEAALQHLREAEQAPRGLYAGPVGWCDGAGNGEAWVALRCGHFCGDRATLWAGAGIVAGSDPLLELQETMLKQRALLAAIDPTSLSIDAPVDFARRPAARGESAS